MVTFSSCRCVTEPCSLSSYRDINPIVEANLITSYIFNSHSEALSPNTIILGWVFVLVWLTAIAKYHRLVAYEQLKCISHCSRDQKSKIQASDNHNLVRTGFLFHRCYPLTVPSCGRRNKMLYRDLLYNDINPTHEEKLTIVTYQRTHFLMSLYLELGVNNIWTGEETSAVRWGVL